jgi:hypothetical protein
MVNPSPAGGPSDCRYRKCVGYWVSILGAARQMNCRILVRPVPAYLAQFRTTMRPVGDRGLDQGVEKPL